MTDKQSKIIAALITQKPKPLTTDDAVELIGDYYCNARFHTGNILSRMVKAGLIYRIKRGVFGLPECRPRPAGSEDLTLTP